jgi:hypothetical protein
VSSKLVTDARLMISLSAIWFGGNGSSASAKMPKTKPEGGHKFYEEFGPIRRSGPPDPKRLASLFEKYGMTLLGPPLTADT